MFRGRYLNDPDIHQCSVAHLLLWCGLLSCRHLAWLTLCSTPYSPLSPDSTDTARSQSHSWLSRGQRLALEHKTQHLQHEAWLTEVSGMNSVNHANKVWRRGLWLQSWSKRVLWYDIFHRFNIMGKGTNISTDFNVERKPCAAVCSEWSVHTLYSLKYHFFAQLARVWWV